MKIPPAGAPSSGVALPRGTLDPRAIQRLVVLGLTGFFLIEAVEAAWLSDDAFITFRVVQNLLAGLGARYNPAERVQAYTHPLWMVTLTFAHAITREPYYSTLFLSLGLAVATLLLVGLVLARSWPAALVALAFACASGSLVEYSTSGLENPLSHLLLVTFAVALFESTTGRRRTLTLGGVAALVLLNRIDHALLVLPALALEVAESSGRRARTLAWLAAAFLPFVAWEAFSIVYYGFPFPNTAYAKLGTGVEAGTLARQGLWYLVDALQNDPALVLGLVVGGVGAVLSRNRRVHALLAGAGLYLLYVVKIGGDFMSGRFLTGPLILALAICCRSPFRPRLALAAALAAVLLSNPAFPYVQTEDGPRLRSGGLGRHGVCDERALYFPFTGLLRGSSGAGSDPIDHPRRQEGLSARARHVAVLRKEAIGITGYYAGPEVHILDPLALADPLLARMPALRGEWRIGHFRRAIPEGYVETLATGTNLLRDPDLARYYDHLSVVVRGPIWSRSRFAEVWRLNTGRYRSLVHDAV